MAANGNYVVIFSVFLWALLVVTWARTTRRLEEDMTCRSCLNEITKLKETVSQLTSTRSVKAAAAADTPVANLYGPNTGPQAMNAGEAFTNWLTTSGSDFSPILQGGMTYENGNITVPLDGVYYVYAQVYYAPQQRESDSNCGMAIYVNNLQWIQVSGQHFSNGVRGLNTQYNGHAKRLTAGDKLILKASDFCTFYFGSIYNVFGAFLIN
ncbi:uncharacterized protein LOC134193040 [Corticium candelabrum]|uniref:uncharacterized protein LOC134193040 n=1 Tax=Corticium candelabrum TaxID=121492 RepID=UPI002E27298F|nr:uncharacterized protein LOC134193040 [Corticium candelabrum]